MEKSRVEISAGVVVAIAAVFVAFALRRISLAESSAQLRFVYGLIRSAIYFALFVLWGYSVHKRIIQRQVHDLMIGVAALMAFWFLLRTIKYLFVPDGTPTVMRYLWYGFYISMLLIPLLCLYVSLSLNKPEHYYLPRWAMLLFVPTTALILLVLTNDFHQLVFTFPPDKVWSDHDYGYAIWYWVIVAWEAACGLTGIGIMMVKSRVQHRREAKILPFIPITTIFIYGALYLLRNPFLYYIAGDITASFCLLFLIILEICLQLDLIRNNTGYKALFHASLIGAQITDKKHCVLLSSATAMQIPAATLQETLSAPVMLPDGIRLSSAPIRGGYVVWQEDVSELSDLLQELTDMDDYLQGENTALTEAYNTSRRRRHLVERNRLYNVMQSQTAHQIQMLSDLTDALETENDPKAKKLLLMKLAVIGAYIKRRNNLIFISENQNVLKVSELKKCISEVTLNLELFDVGCEVRFLLTGELSFFDTMTLFDIFEAALEWGLDSITSVYLLVTKEQDTPELSISLACEPVTPPPQIEGLTAEEQDAGEWMLRFCLPEGGPTE